MTQISINGKKLLDKLTDLGWDYQCLTRSGKETYDEIMTMFGVLEEGETWLEEDKMKIEINKEQRELLKYAVLWYECNDEEEEIIIDELETKLYNAQEQDLLRSVTNMGGL